MQVSIFVQGFHCLLFIVQITHEDMAAFHAHLEEEMRQSCHTAMIIELERCSKPEEFNEERFVSHSEMWNPSHYYPWISPVTVARG